MKRDKIIVAWEELWSVWYNLDYDEYDVMGEALEKFRKELDLPIDKKSIAEN